MGGVVVTLCAGSGCGDDVQSADAEESSTGMDSPTTSTSTTSSTGDPDDSGSSESSSTSSSDASSSSSEGSTGEEMPMPTDARVFYTVTQGTPEQNGTWLVDVLAGELGDPVRVSDEVAYPVSTSPGGRWLADSGPSGIDTPVVRLLDRDAAPAVPASIVDLDDGSGFEWASRFEFAGDESALAVIATDLESSGLFTLALDDEGPGVPWRADTDLPPGARIADLAYMPGAAQLVLVTHDEATDTEALVLSPARDDVPDGIVTVATSLAGEALGDAVASSDGRLLAYRASSDESARGYVVDVEALPAAPVELVLPAQDVRLTNVQIAPDDSGVIFAVRVPMEPQDETWCYWSALEDGVPQAPIELTPDYAWVQGVGAWSPDARWIAMLAADDPENTRLLLRLEDGVPSSPFDLGPIVTSGDSRRAFTADGWYYYVTRVGEQHALMRVDVGGDEPGAPQTVHVAGDVRDYAIAADASTLVVASGNMFGGDYAAYAIELGGSEPGVAVRYDDPAAPGVWLDWLSVTPDGRGAVYERRPDVASGPGYYVDLGMPGVALTLADGVVINTLSVRALP